MGNTTFILTLTLGQYDDRTESVLAVSKDKSKLEAFAVEDMAQRKLRTKLYDEVQAEFHRLLALHPFTEPQPPMRLLRPDPPPRTKEEHAARCEEKWKCESIYREWADRKASYNQSIKTNAIGFVMVNNGINDYDHFDLTYDSYYTRNINEHDYDISEVVEL